MALVSVVVDVVVTNSMLSYFRRQYLQFLFVIITGICFQWSALAESTFGVMTHYYDMQPGLTIAKPIVSYQNNLSQETTINSRLTIDRVETDYDSVSSASQHLGKAESQLDQRQEYMANVSHTIGVWKLDAGYLLSIEEDYRSNSPSIGVSRDFFQRNTTLAMGYAHNFDRVNGRYMQTTEDKDVDNYSVSLTQILSRVSLMQVSYTLQNNQGYLSTGNRQVQLVNGLFYDEYLPDSRVRQAIGLRAAYWLKTGTALHTAYRYYQDDWELSSNTVELKLYQNLLPRLKARAEYRFYDQGTAEFVQQSYTGSEQYLTSANSLKSFTSHLFGIKLSYTPSFIEDAQLAVKYEHYRQSTGLSGDIYMLSGEFIY